jgi:hypothetical protein
LRDSGRCAHGHGSRAPPTQPWLLYFIADCTGCTFNHEIIPSSSLSLHSLVPPTNNKSASDDQQVKLQTATTSGHRSALVVTNRHPLLDSSHKAPLDALLMLEACAWLLCHMVYREPVDIYTLACAEIPYFHSKPGRLAQW